MPAKCSSCGHENDEWVPRARLNEVSKALDDAKAASQAHVDKIRDLESQAAAAGKVPELSAQLETLQAERDKLAREASTAAQEVVLVRAGLHDDEGIQVAKTLYGALPEEGRPSLTEWLAKGHRALQPYMAAGATTQPAAGAESKTGGNEAAGSTQGEGAASPPAPATPSPSSAGKVNGEPGASGEVRLSDLSVEELRKVMPQIRASYASRH